jgi:hypothetical protein
MPAWLSYRPEDFLLFAPRAYWRLFELANAQIWPLQVPILLLGAAILFWAIRPMPWSDRAVFGLMALAWASAGGWFIGIWYVQINWVAAYMVPLFLAQAMLLAWLGFARRRQWFASRRCASEPIGLALVVYALTLHPLVAPLAGRPLGGAELVGIAPDPTAIATLGLVTLMPRGAAGWLMLVAPVLWCIVSTATLLTMGAWEGWIPLTAVILTFVARLWPRPE